MKRNFAVVILCSAVVLTLLQSASAADKIYGQSMPHDELLLDKYVNKSWKIKGKVEKTLHFTDANYQITFIEILDQHNDEHSAKAEIISGGIGRNYVDIKFTSQIFRGIYYRVKIHGIRLPFIPKAKAV